MHRNPTPRPPLTAKARRAALRVLLLAALPLASCAELMSTLDNASRAYLLYEQTRGSRELPPPTETAPMPEPPADPAADGDPFAAALQSLAQLQADRRR